MQVELVETGNTSLQFISKPIPLNQMQVLLNIANVTILTLFLQKELSY